jgi:hypothetical protein
VCILLRITLVTSGHLRECEWKTIGVSLRQDLEWRKSGPQCLERNGLVASPLRLLQCDGCTPRRLREGLDGRFPQKLVWKLH